MKIWRCKCGWLITNMDFLRVNYDAECPRCGRLYSTFSAAPEIHIDASRSVPSNRRRKAKRQTGK